MDLTMAAESTEAKNTAADDVIATAAAPGDKRKLSPDISAEQANAMKKLKETKTQPGRCRTLYTVVSVVILLLLWCFPFFRRAVPVPSEVFGPRAAAVEGRTVQGVRRDGKRRRAKQIPAEVHRGPTRCQPVVQQGDHGQRQTAEEDPLQVQNPVDRVRRFYVE